MLHAESTSSAAQSIDDKHGHAVNEALITCNVSGITMLKKSGRP